MSAGVFVRAKYKERLTPTNIHPILVQPETMDLTIDGHVNAEPTETVNQEGLMKTSKTKREYGKTPLSVIVQFGDDAPEGYKKNGKTMLPLLDTAIQDAVAAVEGFGLTGTYLTKDITTVGIRDEQFR